MLFKLLYILNPIVFNRVWKRAKEVVAVFHSFGEYFINFFVVGIVVNKIKHIDPVASLANPLDSADPLLKSGWIPRQVHIDECPEGLKIETFAGCVSGHKKANSSITYGFLDIVALYTSPLPSEKES